MSVRFAPSPTGRFHVGNLRTAWLSHRIARELGLPWVVRFEDIDRPRVVAGSRESQLADMAAIGLVPDLLKDQSLQHARHAELFAEAVASGKAYPCFCSRKDLQRLVDQSTSAPHEAPPAYDGLCRTCETWPAILPAQLGWRFRAADLSGAQDWLIGRTSNPALKKGEIPAPRDFIPSYNWACAIDDFDGRHRVLVRAADLAHVLPLQREAQTWLAERVCPHPPWSPPAVLHAALVTLPDGGRLEKRTQGITLSELEVAGISPTDLLSAFSESLGDSWRRWRDGVVPGAVLSEIPARISLSRLGVLPPPERP